MINLCSFPSHRPQLRLTTPIITPLPILLTTRQSRRSIATPPMRTIPPPRLTPCPLRRRLSRPIHRWLGRTRPCSPYLTTKQEPERRQCSHNNRYRRLDMTSHAEKHGPISKRGGIRVRSSLCDLCEACEREGDDDGAKGEYDS